MSKENYQLLNEIHRGVITMVYAAENLQTHQECAIKQLTEDYPSPKFVAAMKYEYSILKDLEIKNVAKVYDLITLNNNPALVLEKLKGHTLKYWMQHHEIELADALHIMIEVAEGLSEIHQNQIIHKDINPSNIIWDPNTGSVKIIDFNNASLLPQEKHEITNLDNLEGSLSYISPEQTGRMNRALDYRTDFYSFGVTFFEVLTKQLPFQSSDPMEMLHLHIAKEPPIPSNINHDIPVVLSSIILKCLQKSAEHRYQSAYGILYDLKQCLKQLIEMGYASA